MNNFIGLKGTKRLLELLLKRLSMKESTLTEIEEEELKRMYSAQTGTELDLSWIASQESVDSVDTKVNELKDMINDAIVKVDQAISQGEMNAAEISAMNAKIDSCMDMIEQIGSKDDPSFGGYHVAPVGELSKWNYTLDDDKRIVTLTSLKSAASNVTVYDKYDLDGAYYRTRITNSTRFNVSGTFKIWNKVINEITTLASMFSGCSSLTSVDFGTSFDGNVITSMNKTFYNCTGLRGGNISNLPDTSKVTDMSHAFDGLGNSGVYTSGLNSLNLDTSSVTDMSYAFANTKHDYYYSYQSNNIFKKLNLENVTNASYMFYKANFEVDMSDYTTSITMPSMPKATDMSYMFNGVSSNKINSAVKAIMYLENLRVPETCTTVRNIFGAMTNIKELHVRKPNWSVPSGCDNTSYIAGSSFSSILS